MDSFRRGLHVRSPLVLVAAAALLVPALLGIQAFFTSGAWTSVPLGYWLRNSSDSFVYVSWIVGDARRRPPSTPAVYLLGGSAAREALVNGDDLAAEIADLGGPRVAAYDLGVSNQNFAESLAVADNVPDSPAWVLIGVNLGRFTIDRASSAQQARGRELLLDSRQVQRFVSEEWGLERYSYTIAPGIFAYVTDHLRRDGAALLKGTLKRRPYRLHHYSAARVRSAAHKRRLVAIWNKRRYPLLRANVGANLALLEELLRRCRERGVNAVIVELPINGEIVGDAFDPAIQRYRAPTQTLARRYGAAYVDFNDELRIADSSFYDLSHLVEPGRSIWQHALAQALVKLMNDGENGKGSG